MSLRDLFSPVRKPAATFAARIPLRIRLRKALERPPMPNQYITPGLRSVDAVAFALRGYAVEWTPAEHCGHISGELIPSALVYLNEGRTGTVVRVELPTIIPGEIQRAASWIRGARVIGWRFALWQAKRDIEMMRAVRR